MKKLLVVAALAAAWVGGYGYGRWYAKPPAGEKKPLYWVDPMHPWYKSDRPGIAPDCNMALVPVYAGDEARYERRANQLPEGSVQIPPEKQQLIGVEFGTVEQETAHNSIRAVARVTLDETRIAKVHTKLEGWIERVFADFTGKQVRQGEPLLTFYSPEALATQQEYLLAIKAQHAMHDNPVHEMLGSTENMVAAAKKRLELWDIGEKEISEVTATGAPLKNLTLSSPITGYVMERNAFPRQRITPEMTLYTVADLSRVWVLADVYEYEAAAVRLGMGATLRLTGQPGRTYYGKVSYILPQVDAATRTLKVRIEFANADLSLKPDMYGEVELAAGGGRRLVVPRGAGQGLL